MHAHHSTLGHLQADQMIVALQHLDKDGKEAVLRIIMTAAKHAYWVRDAIQDAITQQLQEQRDLDAWIEQEATLDAARHGDPYAMSKFGDAAFSTTQ